MTEMSSTLRRMMAVGILILLVATGFQLILVPSIDWMNANLAALDNSRFQIDRLEQLESEPPLPAGQKLPDGILISARSREEAEKVAILHIQAIAKRHELAAIHLLPLGKQPLPSMLAIEMNVVGPEKNIVAFIEDLENSVPLTRFPKWKLSTRTGEGETNNLTLTAIVRSIWAAR